MEDYRINRNYARALFLVASETGQLDAANADMRLVNSVCNENHLLNTVFANPVMPEGKKVAILSDLFEQHIAKISMLFLKFVVRKRRTINLKGISNAFIEMYREANNIIRTDLVTADETDEQTRERVRKAIGAYTKKDVELNAKVDPDIIGGFSITFDNNMYDARVSSMIAKLYKEFSKNVYESKL